MTNLRTMFNGCMKTDAIENAGLTSILPDFGKDGEFGGWPMVQDAWTDDKSVQFSLLPSSAQASTQA